MSICLLLIFFKFILEDLFENLGKRKKFKEI